MLALIMRQALDPKTLKKGDKIYIEAADNVQWSNVQFEIKRSQNVSTTDSNKDTYVEMVAILKGRDGTEIKSRKKTKECGFPSYRYSSKTLFFMKVLYMKIELTKLTLTNPSKLEQPPDIETTKKDLGNSKQHRTRTLIVSLSGEMNRAGPLGALKYPINHTSFLH